MFKLSYLIVTCLYQRNAYLQPNALFYQIQSLLEETLQSVGAKAMVVGHTPQPMGVNW